MKEELTVLIRTMLIKNNNEMCPYCFKILKDYEGLHICYCKFCGGKIFR